MHHVVSRLALVLFALAALSACAAGQHTCRAGSECPSGICNTDGTCAMPRDAGPRADGGGLDDAWSGDDAGDQDAFADDTGVRVCSPNADGVITQDEVPLRAGLHATFRVAQNATFDTAGAMVGGVLTWDLSAALSGDADTRVELLDPSGAWWAGSFPTATYAASLSASSDNLGVFQITDGALQLLGIVSPTDGVTRTLLSYDPPVTVLAFPVQSGATWMTSSNVTGQALGVITTYTERYVSNVDASGSLVTPLGTMDVLRVRTDMTRLTGVVPVATQRTFGFVAECFGTAATITSQQNETSVDFTRAAEIRRLAP